MDDEGEEVDESDADFFGRLAAWLDGLEPRTAAPRESERDTLRHSGSDTLVGSTLLNAKAVENSEAQGSSLPESPCVKVGFKVSVAPDKTVPRLDAATLHIHNLLYS